MDTPVKVGQVWVDNDPRVLDVRRLKIEEIKNGKARCSVFFGRQGAGWTKISVHRFKPTSNGYRLELDVANPTLVQAKEEMKRPGKDKTYKQLEKHHDALQAEVRRLNLQLREVREECAKIAESEPWPEGPAPAEVVAISASLTYEQIIQATVKATRESIAKKIRQNIESGRNETDKP